MAAKSDDTFAGIRCTREEKQFLQDCATFLCTEQTELIKLCIAIALPIILFNEFVRRTRLEDIMRTIWLYVKTSLAQRKT